METVFGIYVSACVLLLVHTGCEVFQCGERAFAENVGVAHMPGKRPSRSQAFLLEEDQSVTVDG